MGSPQDLGWRKVWIVVSYLTLSSILLVFYLTIIGTCFQLRRRVSEQDDQSYGTSQGSWFQSHQKQHLSLWCYQRRGWSHPVSSECASYPCWWTSSSLKYRFSSGISITLSNPLPLHLPVHWTTWRPWAGTTSYNPSLLPLPTTVIQ